MPERGFSTDYWADSFIETLPAEGKLLFAYLWTNPHCNQAGLYEITLGRIAYETSLPADNLPSLMKALEPKVKWYPDKNLVWVKNFIKRQSKSPKFLVAVAKSLSAIHNNGAISELLEYNLKRYNISIPYGYSIDSVGIPSTSISNASTGSSSDKSLFSGDLFSLSELQILLGEMPSGVDKLAQHEAIKQRLADLGTAKGYVVRSEYAMPGGRVDLCWLTQQGEVVAGFEIDYRTPRDKSLAKLRLLRCRHAYVLLRKGGLRFIPVEQMEDVEATGKLIPRDELSTETRAIISFLGQLKGWQADEDDVLWHQGLRSEFPGCTLAELKACVDYYSGKLPPKHKGIWKNRFRNWMIKKQEFEMKEGKGEQRPRQERARPITYIRGSEEVPGKD